MQQNNEMYEKETIPLKLTFSKDWSLNLFSTIEVNLQN